MGSDRILQLLARQMGREISEKEKAELKALLSDHPEYHYFIEILESLEGEKKHQAPAIEEKELVDEGWRQLHEELEPGQDARKNKDKEKPLETRKPSTKKRFLRAAIWTGVIILGLSSLLIWKPWRAEGVKQSRLAVQPDQLNVPSGAPQKKALPDGTVVWLNARSNLRFSKGFGYGSREVFLEGEAYFDVRHDPDHPFIVHARGIDIRVLGTAFNVEAYADEDQVATTLINGKIKVEVAGYPDKSLILRPHEKLSVSTKGTGFQREAPKRIESQPKKELKFKVQELKASKSIGSLPEVAWMEDKLVFQNERFDEVSKSLERRFGVKIIFESEDLKKERLSGVFKNETIRKALEVLQMTTPFSYERSGDKVYLKAIERWGDKAMGR